MKILVTGGAGFIGGNFVHHMVNKYPDYEIVNLDLLTYAGNLETLKPVEDKPNYKFVKGDIADREFIMDLFEKEKFDVVVINFLNKKNAADRRVYELLSTKFNLFEGVFGASDEKRGYKTLGTQIHPKTEVISGVLEKECAELMTSFFQKKR